MARTNLLEDIFHMLRKLPWWAGVISAAVFWIMGKVITAGMTNSGLESAFRPITQWLFNGFAVVALVAASVSAIQSLFRRKPLAGQSDLPSAPDDIACPRCGSPMTLRTAKRGANAGGSFYGCTRYPGCKGIRPVA